MTIKKQNEKEWIQKRMELQKASTRYITIGYMLLLIGIWFLPAWYLKIICMGLWLIVLGLLVRKARAG